MKNYYNGEIRSADGTIKGVLLSDTNGAPRAIKAAACFGFLDIGRGANAKCCNECAAVGRTVQSRRHSAQRSGDTRSPRLKNKLSFADHAYVKGLRAKNANL